MTGLKKEPSELMQQLHMIVKRACHGSFIGVDKNDMQSIIKQVEVLESENADLKTLLEREKLQGKIFEGMAKNMARSLKDQSTHGLMNDFDDVGNGRE